MAYFFLFHTMPFWLEPQKKLLLLMLTDAATRPKPGQTLETTLESTAMTSHSHAQFMDAITPASPMIVQRVTPPEFIATKNHSSAQFVISEQNGAKI